jgi:hypothetical protein
MVDLTRQPRSSAETLIHNFLNCNVSRHFEHIILCGRVSQIKNLMFEQFLESCRIKNGTVK